MPCLPHPGHDSYWDTESLSNLLFTQYFVSPAGQKAVSPSFYILEHFLIYDPVHRDLELEGWILEEAKCLSLPSYPFNVKIMSQRNEGIRSIPTDPKVHRQPKSSLTMPAVIITKSGDCQESLVKRGGRN